MQIQTIRTKIIKVASKLVKSGRSHFTLNCHLTLYTKVFLKYSSANSGIKAGMNITFTIYKNPSSSREESVQKRQFSGLWLYNLSKIKDSSN